MPLTYGEARRILARYANVGGKCPSSEETGFFVRQVLEYLLVSGDYGNLRKFVFNAVKGVFTVPPELEVPLKVKIDNEVGSSWDRWFEYHSTNDIGCDCMPAANAIFEDPNNYPTAYEIPDGGARVGVIATCEEAEDAFVIVQGVDLYGKEVFTHHKGAQISGEYLNIKKGQIIYSQSAFTRISGILKAKTNGYVQLLWVNPTTNLKGLLSDYSPLEEKPSYRRYKIKAANCGNSVRVTVLGRIKLKPAYADTDYIPFDSIYALNLAAQSINANFNGDVQTAQAKDLMMQNVIEKTNEYKRVQNGQPIEVFQPLSAGSIQNIVGGLGWGRRWP